MSKLYIVAHTCYCIHSFFKDEVGGLGFVVSLGEIARHCIFAYEYVCVKVCVLYLDICIQIDLSLCPPPLSIYIYL